MFSIIIICVLVLFIFYLILFVLFLDVLLTSAAWRGLSGVAIIYIGHWLTHWLLVCLSLLHAVWCPWPYPTYQRIRYVRPWAISLSWRNDGLARAVDGKYFATKIKHLKLHPKIPNRSQTTTNKSMRIAPWCWARPSDKSRGWSPYPQFNVAEHFLPRRRYSGVVPTLNLGLGAFLFSQLAYVSMVIIATRRAHVDSFWYHVFLLRNIYHHLSGLLH